MTATLNDFFYSCLIFRVWGMSTGCNVLPFISFFYYPLFAVLICIDEALLSITICHAATTIAGHLFYGYLLVGGSPLWEEG